MKFDEPNSYSVEQRFCHQHLDTAIKAKNCISVLASAKHGQQKHINI